MVNFCLAGGQTTQLQLKYNFSDTLL